MGIAICGGGFVLLLLAAAVFLVGLYNRLVTLRNRVDNGWAQIDVQLKKRYDLIPNIIALVQEYAAHESGTFEKVTQARNMAVDASSVGEQAQAENMLSGALKSLFAVAEAYPELKANQNFMAAQEELSGIESKIAYARQFYNDTVMTHNTAIQKFPAVLIAGMLGFKDREYFEIEEATEREAPDVKELLNR